MPSSSLPDNSKVDPRLEDAKFFANIGEFKKCKKSAYKAYKSDPTHLETRQILTIAIVLSVTTSNHYSILQLPFLTQDLNLIKARFEKFSVLLDPSKNPFPFASKAYTLVTKAWSILSNPTNKYQYDNDLKADRGRHYFWTMCSYCKYAYEYENFYCYSQLQCPNETCHKEFQAKPTKGPWMSTEVGEKMRYECKGFFFRDDKYRWAPYVSVSSANRDVNEDNGDEGAKKVIIVISDDEMELEDVGIENKSIGKNVKNIEIKGKSENNKKLGLRKKTLAIQKPKKFKGKGLRTKNSDVCPIEGVSVEGNKSEGAQFGGESSKDAQNVKSFDGINNDANIYVGYTNSARKI